jgi:hypothetical protein
MAPEDGPRAAAAGGGRGGDAGWAEDEDGEGGGAAPHFEIKQRRTAGPGAASGARRRYHCAPASGRGALGLLRRYELGAVLAKAVVRGLGTADLDFPIKVGQQPSMGSCGGSWSAIVWENRCRRRVVGVGGHWYAAAAWLPCMQPFKCMIISRSQASRRRCWVRRDDPCLDH